MKGWKASVIVEGQPIWIHGVNVWEHDWTRIEEPPVELPHPSYPSQLHLMHIYEIETDSESIRFAAAELSVNVWGFYIPQ